LSDLKEKPAEILVIDDDPIMRDLVADWLEAAGYSVHKATDCNAACTALEQRAPATCGCRGLAEPPPSHF
jgi:CheY-like chemotaxis protein